VVEQPDFKNKTADTPIESWVTQYFDETGQPLHRIQTDDDPSTATNVWASKVRRSSTGQVTDVASPANVTAYTHSTASFTTSSSAGLYNLSTRIASGDMKGLPYQRKHKTGTSGSAYLDLTLTYTSRDLTVGDVSVTRPFVASQRVYTQEITLGTTGSRLTSYSHTFHSATATDVLYLAPKKITTTNPAVSTGNNGSGSSTTSNRYIREEGSTAFTEAEDGIFTYSLFTEGQLTKQINDAQTNHATDFASGDDPNTDFGITETGDGKRVITTYAYDDQGRSDTVTQPDGRVLKRYYSELADERLITLSYNDYDSAPLKFYGPVQYSVTNHGGKSEAQATVALTSNESTTALTGHVDETDSDLITAMDLGTVARLSTTIYDETGSSAQESRLYFDIPTSGAGSDGTNYDPTTFAYNDQGRKIRSKAPHGTITRTNYDTLGRATSQWIGTNDSDFVNGESSGTDNMVKTSETEYDSGNDKGNSLVTKRTLFVEDSATDERVTSFSRDVRGWVLLQTNPETPHHFNKYDNMGRVIASGQFSSTASIVVGTDDPTTETTNRLGLSQTFYDEMGRVWKTQRHKIDQSDGSDDDDLESLAWYDAAGRTIKVDGQRLAKTSYDRLGRQTHRFMLASDNDTAYAHADDVTGDIVLLEQQTVYESYDSSGVVMSAVISRHHDDYGGSETTGALDTNADADDLKYTATNIEGRIRITASWYDRFGRVTDQVRYGTYGGSDFDRDGLSVPARSDTALLIESVYNTDGSLQSTTDPRDLEARFEYDDAGRRITVISNYVNGTPSGPTGDDDNHVRYEYVDGLQTKMWVDLDGDDVEDADDQVTLYIFGVSSGASAGDSEIDAGHLLRATVYPDSTNTATTSADIDTDDSDVMSFAYNAQGQEIYRKDQDGTIIDTTYDDAGRVETKAASTLASGIDSTVRRVATAYDNLGRVDTVTQYDAVSAGNVVNEVKRAYDDWGPVSKIEQDHDSAVGGTMLFDVDFTYTEATGGRNTIRRSTMDLPDGQRLTLDYLSSGSLHDDEASRVSRVKIGIINQVTIADYDYNGVSELVGTDYPEIDVMWLRYGTTSGSYPDLDRFGRVTSSRWTKDLATDQDFYDVDITHDRNSDITLTENNVHDGFDVEYQIDNLNRLTNAEEGTWNGSTITSATREQLWTTLSQTGSWDRVKFDLDGDGDFTGVSGEYDDTRTHNVASELTARDIDSNATNDYNLSHTSAGQLDDDDEKYEYVFDAFGRLRKIKQTDGDRNVVAEYKYNGLGHRIAWHYDADADGDVDTSDPWYRFIYDDRWRIVATYRGASASTSDSDPKEQFVYHNAGSDGLGSASYIDDVILRDKDANTDWDAAADGALEERVYYCQNWRHDVVALIDSSGGQLEQVRYTAYGIPDGLPAGDADSDGDVDSTDASIVNGWITSGYDVRGDLDLDGDVDSSDHSAVQALDGNSLGFGALSLPEIANRKAYAGYEFDDALGSAFRFYHVRHRVLNSDLGRWLTRDPAAYADGPNLYSYGLSQPLKGTDPLGLTPHLQTTGSGAELVPQKFGPGCPNPTCSGVEHTCDLTVWTTPNCPPLELVLQAICSPITPPHPSLPPETATGCGGSGCLCIRTSTTTLVTVTSVYTFTVPWMCSLDPLDPVDFVAVAILLVEEAVRYTGRCDPLLRHYNPLLLPL
ncbi:MAG: RHS repeat-associated core domain-containing protein, partial [Acidimicrobiia bacterium]|nr:RHS repeat-associated core domain-containing protein [Acidimicrobiia bacterium]